MRVLSLCAVGRLEARSALGFPFRGLRGRVGLKPRFFDFLHHSALKDGVICAVIIGLDINSMPCPLGQGISCPKEKWALAQNYFTI